MGHEMKGRTVNMEIKKALHDSIIVPTLTCARQPRTWNEGQRSRIQAVKMSYLRGGCCLNSMDGERNETVYGKFSISFKSEGMSCGVVEVVKCSNFRGFGHMERMGGDELTKKIHKSGIDAVGVRGRPL